MKIALQLPGFSDPISRPEGLKPEFTNVASLLSGLGNIAFYIVMFVTFYFLIWGAFAYILAQGKKEDLAKARARITWALVGLIVTLLAFLLARFGAEILPPTQGGLPF